MPEPVAPSAAVNAAAERILRPTAVQATEAAKNGGRYVDEVGNEIDTTNAANGMVSIANAVTKRNPSYEGLQKVGEGLIQKESAALDAKLDSVKGRVVDNPHVNSAAEALIELYEGDTSTAARSKVARFSELLNKSRSQTGLTAREVTELKRAHTSENKLFNEKGQKTGKGKSSEELRNQRTDLKNIVEDMAAQEGVTGIAETNAKIGELIDATNQIASKVGEKAAAKAKYQAPSLMSKAGKVIGNLPGIHGGLDVVRGALDLKNAGEGKTTSILDAEKSLGKFVRDLRKAGKNVPAGELPARETSSAYNATPSEVAKRELPSRVEAANKAVTGMAESGPGAVPNAKGQVFNANPNADVTGGKNRGINIGGRKLLPAASETTKAEQAAQAAQQAQYAAAKGQKINLNRDANAGVPVAEEGATKALPAPKKAFPESLADLAKQEKGLAKSLADGTAIPKYIKTKLKEVRAKVDALRSAILNPKTLSEAQQAMEAMKRAPRDSWNIKNKARLQEIIDDMSGKWSKENLSSAGSTAPAGINLPK
jgi:hypothetical protein